MGGEGEGELLAAPGIFDVRNSHSAKPLLVCSVSVHPLFISKRFSFTKRSQKEAGPALSRNTPSKPKAWLWNVCESYIQHTWLGCERSCAFPGGVILTCTIWSVRFLSLSMGILESHFSVWNAAKDSSVLQHHLRAMEDCSEGLQMLFLLLLEEKLPWGLVICTVNWLGG